jgi:hypothetical protein
VIGEGDSSGGASNRSSGKVLTLSTIAGTLAMKLAVNTAAAQVFTESVSAKVSGDLGFAVSLLSPSSVEIGGQGRVAAVGEHAPYLLRQDAL